MFVGLASAFAGVLAILINVSFWPTVGDGYLLIVLAAVFIGGTPTWGGVGTIAGAVCGAFTVGFIESGIVAAGLTGFYTQLFEGLVIILSLVAHRLNRPRYYRGVGTFTIHGLCAPSPPVPRPWPAGGRQDRGLALEHHPRLDDLARRHVLPAAEALRPAWLKHAVREYMLR